MTRLVLARHALHDWVGRGFAGRMPGVALNAQGLRQAEELASRLGDLAIDAIYSSPQQRARQTAALAAVRLKLPVLIAPEFDEVELGRWTGLAFDEVMRSDAARWHEWVQHKSRAAAPGGEPFAQVQRRAMAGVERLRQVHPRSDVLVFSHGDVIKAVLATCLRMSMDDLERFDVDCASLSIIKWAGDAAKVELMNG